MGTLRLKEGFRKYSKFCGNCKRNAEIGFTDQKKVFDIMCSIFGVFLKRNNKGKLLRCKECKNSETIMVKT